MGPWVQQVNQAIHLLESAGFEAWLVGGCVRDFLMETVPSDYDLATNARPEEVKGVFSGYRVVETGLQHGTVTVLLDKMPLEITTFRVEEGYSDGRHPDGVAFAASIEEDLARRDFTVNAMAFHPEKGLRDPFGGQRDMEDKLIRCVGAPDRRLGEDALRILRALRFASVLGFEIEERTGKALVEHRRTLECISRERVAAELTKLLCGVAVKRVLLDYVDVLGVVIPELLPMVGFDQRSKYHCYDVLTHTAVALDHTPPEKVLRWAVLLHDIGKPAAFTMDEGGEGHFYGHATVSAALTQEILDRLRFDRQTRERIVTLVKAHDMSMEDEPKQVRRWLNRLGEAAYFDLLQVKRADNWGQADRFHDRQQCFDRLERLGQILLEEEGVFGLKDLAVNGHDLMQQGYAGKEVGLRLQLLLNAVLSERVKNVKEDLLGYEERQPQKDRRDCCKF